MKNNDESLARWMEFIGIERCICPFEWKESIGKLYGIGMGPGWVRMDTNPECEHHGRGNHGRHKTSS